jgi:hypothetical protein
MEVAALLLGRDEVQDTQNTTLKHNISRHTLKDLSDCQQQGSNLRRTLPSGTDLRRHHHSAMLTQYDSSSTSLYRS